MRLPKINETVAILYQSYPTKYKQDLFLIPIATFYFKFYTCLLIQAKIELI